MKNGTIDCSITQVVCHTIADASAGRHTLANALELVKATRGKVRMIIKHQFGISVQVPQDIV